MFVLHVQGLIDERIEKSRVTGGIQTRTMLIMRCVLYRCAGSHKLFSIPALEHRPARCFADTIMILLSGAQTNKPGLFSFTDQ